MPAPKGEVERCGVGHKGGPVGDLAAGSVALAKVAVRRAARAPVAVAESNVVKGAGEGRRVLPKRARLRRHVGNVAGHKVVVGLRARVGGARLAAARATRRVAPRKVVRASAARRHARALPAPHVVLALDARGRARGVQRVGEGGDVLEGGKVVGPLAQPVHAVLVGGHAAQKRRAGGGATRHRGEGAVKSDAAGGQAVDVRRWERTLAVRS